MKKEITLYKIRRGEIVAVPATETKKQISLGPWGASYRPRIDKSRWNIIGEYEGAVVYAKDGDLYSENKGALIEAELERANRHIDEARTHLKALEVELTRLYVLQVNEKKSK